jgi:hypothetical protein
MVADLFYDIPLNRTLDLTGNHKGRFKLFCSQPQSCIHVSPYVRWAWWAGRGKGWQAPEELHLGRQLPRATCRGSFSASGVARSTLKALATGVA